MGSVYRRTAPAQRSSSGSHTASVVVFFFLTSSSITKIDPRSHRPADRVFGGQAGARSSSTSPHGSPHVAANMPDPSSRYMPHDGSPPEPLLPQLAGTTPFTGATQPVGHVDYSRGQSTIKPNTATVGSRTSAASSFFSALPSLRYRNKLFLAQLLPRLCISTAEAVAPSKSPVVNDLPRSPFARNASELHRQQGMPSGYEYPSPRSGV